ncbi:TIGR01777 family oxidoreductase [uncultured Paraglaciecola sp.]|uniref:TIGR01777 family oxidoreductase n=1 Tax=uncultured Paraglaciecola sp. TaxID=1765024 RepID=UPI00260460C1|nr:TIGR01777 family oxidoreductase [uncultured Paraglaciecola sp.]
MQHYSKDAKKILITGGSGLIGSSLIPVLRPCDVAVYTRNVAMAEQILGHKIHYLSTLSHLTNLDDYDVVINLAGEPIANQKWTDEQKHKIEQSRWSITEQIVALINEGTNPPGLLISGSAIGYYGRQQAQIIDEDFSTPHQEFSHLLCKRWESLASQAQSDKTRVCIIRTGIVITKRGGALHKMLLPFKLGLGGPIGDGSQYMSWIHLEDVLRGIAHLVAHDSCEGIYNFTAPNPVTNAEFSRELASALSRPCFFRMPKSVLRMVIGEMADLLLYGQRVVPTRLQQSGYEFIYPQITQALDCVRR